MSNVLPAFIQPLGILLTLTLSSVLTVAQHNAGAALRFSDDSPTRIILDAEPPLPTITPAEVIAAFIRAETLTREALNQHTFKRDVLLQTIGSQGRVTGEYIRNSQFLFDDSGNRIERVLYHPPSTIRELRITREDIQDLAGAQLLGFDIVETDKYNLAYIGRETLDERDVHAIDVTPTRTPNPWRMKERFFIGRVWIDSVSFQIVKVKGVVEPQGKQRFPRFETWREPAGAPLPFPVRTLADEVLSFPDRDVHYRISVRYYDYKRFASRVTIREIDPPIK